MYYQGSEVSRPVEMVREALQSMAPALSPQCFVNSKRALPDVNLQSNNHKDL